MAVSEAIQHLQQAFSLALLILISDKSEISIKRFWRSLLQQLELLLIGTEVLANGYSIVEEHDSISS